MAIGDSETDICNIGLIEIGEDPISSVFPPDNSKSAILCNKRFHQIRRSVLRMSTFWNCAKRQVQLAQSATAPPFTYAAAYPVPADFIRVVELPENSQAVYEVMNLAGIGTCIVCNEGAPLALVYIFDLQDPTQMDPLLIDAIGYEIGAKLAQPLGQDKALADRAEARGASAIAAAELPSAQENFVRELDIDVALRARA